MGTDGRYRICREMAVDRDGVAQWEQLAGLRRLSVAFVSFRVACASSSESTKNVSSTTRGAARLAV